MSERKSSPYSLRERGVSWTLALLRGRCIPAAESTLQRSCNGLNHTSSSTAELSFFLEITEKGRRKLLGDPETQNRKGRRKLRLDYHLCSSYPTWMGRICRMRCLTPLGDDCATGCPCSRFFLSLSLPPSLSESQYTRQTHTPPDMSC